MITKYFAQLTVACVVGSGMTAIAQGPNFVSLFNGKDLAGWKIPEGDNGHWKVVDGVIDYDAASEATGRQEPLDRRRLRRLRPPHRLADQGNAVRQPERPIHPPDGTHKKDADGKEIRISVPDADSGVFLRGDEQVPGEHLVLADRLGRGLRLSHGREDAAGGAGRRHPVKNADKHVGEWNTFEITVRGDRLTVVLNGQTVINAAEFPSFRRRTGRPPASWSKKGGVWTSPPALVQFRNISIAELR